MPLDPQVKTMLEEMNANPMPALTTLSPAAAREQVKAMLPPVPGPEMARVVDRAIPGPNGDIAVRIYTPSGNGPHPAVVFFHGGGWVVCDIEMYDGTCRQLADGAACIVVSVDYRLAPEHKFPMPVEDCYVATAWVDEQARAIGARTSGVAVAGDSAGGNLAAAVCLMARDRGGPRIVQQTLVYPATNHSFDTPSYRDNGADYFLTVEDCRWFWNHYLTNDADGGDRYASPLLAEDLRGLPPALIITAEFDPLRDEGEAYASRLQAAGVPVTCTRYDGMIHGFFSMTANIDRANDAVKEACASLRGAFTTVPV